MTWWRRAGLLRLQVPDHIYQDFDTPHKVPIITHLPSLYFSGVHVKDVDRIGMHVQEIAVKKMQAKCQLWSFRFDLQ